jgi:HEAT repeat protein
VADSGGTQTTFELLAQTENEAAVELLIPALDSPERAIQEGALRSLLQRRSRTGQREILQRLHLVDDCWKAIIEEHRASMSYALRDAILDSSPQLCANGCQAILWFREYDLLPALVNALEDEANPNAALAGATLLSLMDLFYSELSGEGPWRQRRDPELLRQRMLNCLEESVHRFGRHHRIAVIEAFLMLSAYDNLTLRRILLDPLDGGYLPLIDVLTHSVRPGVQRLILDFLDDPHAPSSTLALIAHRSDLPFIERLLRRIGAEPTATVRHNLARVGGIAWLREPRPLIDALDEIHQPALVQLVQASSMNRLEGFGVIACLAVQGKVAGRRAAVGALRDFHGVEANKVAIKSLEDDDDEVQANALRQLRDRGIPGAISILIDALASPSELVRAAARECLTEFTFPRYLATFDMLDEDVRHTTGLLVKKIDPETVPLLREEMKSPSRRRRIRALQMAEAIQVELELQEEILLAIADSDHLVRLEAARALGQCGSVAAYAALREAETDRSLTVREAAAASLERIARSSPELELLSGYRAAEEQLHE